MMGGGAFWAGRFLAFNFNDYEDLDRDGNLGNDERAKLLAPPGGGNTPIFNRVWNFGLRIGRELQSQREVVSRVSATEWPEYGMAFVTGTDGLQNRTNWLGYAGLWCTIWPELGWNEQFPVFAEELAHLWLPWHSSSSYISGPAAYDLLGKRRVPKPKDVMAASLDKPLRDSFLKDSDYDLVHAGIVERIPRQLERNRAGQPIAERTTGTSESGLRTFFVGTLHPGGYVEVAAAGPYAAGGRRIQGDDITLRLLDDNDREIGRGGLGFVVPPKAVHDQDPPASADRQLFAGELAFNERVRTVVVERRGRELKRLKVPVQAPTVVISTPMPAFDNVWVDLQWTGTDPGNFPLSYDVSLLYPSTGRVVLLGSHLHQSGLRVRTTLLPGGDDVLLHVVATNGFLRGEDTVSGLQVPDRSPFVSILSPVDGDSYRIDAIVALAATAWDTAHGTLSGDQLRWSSDRDGELSTGTDTVARLSPGSHIITAEAVGQTGRLGRVQVKVIVQ